MFPFDEDSKPKNRRPRSESTSRANGQRFQPPILISRAFSEPLKAPLIGRAYIPPSPEQIEANEELICVGSPPDHQRVPPPDQRKRW